MKSVLTLSLVLVFCMSMPFLIQDAFAENAFSDNYNKSQTVLVGKVLSLEQRHNETAYEVQVEKYYKNPQSAKAIAVFGPAKGIYFSYDPTFDLGDRLFLYLKQRDGIWEIQSSSFKLQYNCDAGGLVPPPSETYSHGMPASDNYPTFSDADFIGDIHKVGNKMQVKYTVHNYTPLIKHATVTILINGTNQNKTVFSEQKTAIVPACNGSVPLEWSFTPQRSDDYVVQAKVSSGYDIPQRYVVSIDEPYVASSFQVRENVAGGPIDKTIHPIIKSPLQQFKSGIQSQQVSCKEGLVLVIKTSNSQPMCVKPSTKSKLLQKGLAEMPIITEEGFVVPRPDLFLQIPLRIEGLNQTQYVGQKIEFTIEYNGTKSHCSFYPSFHIENAEHKTVWKSNYILELCDPDITPTHFEREWKIGNSALGTPIVNMTGFYTLFAEFENDIIQHDFWVKSHSDVKIIGLEETYKVGDNVKFYVTVQGFGMIPCEDFTVSIKNDRGQTILDVPAYNGSCPIPVEPANYEFYFPQKNDSYTLFVNQTGKYTISAHFGDDSLEKEFVVRENNQIK